MPHALMLSALLFTCASRKTLLEDVREDKRLGSELISAFASRPLLRRSGSADGITVITRNRMGNDDGKSQSRLSPGSRWHWPGQGGGYRKDCGQGRGRGLNQGQGGKRKRIGIGIGLIVRFWGSGSPPQAAAAP